MSLTALIFPWHRLELLGKPAGTTASPAAFQGHWHSTINQCVQKHFPQKLFSLICVCSLYNHILTPTVQHKCTGFPTVWKGEGQHLQGRNRTNRFIYSFFTGKWLCMTFLSWYCANRDSSLLTPECLCQLLFPWAVCRGHATSSSFPLRMRQTNWVCQKDTQKSHSFHFRDLMASYIPFQTEPELWHGTRLYLQTFKVILEPKATMFIVAWRSREGKTLLPFSSKEIKGWMPSFVSEALHWFHWERWLTFSVYCPLYSQLAKSESSVVLIWCSHRSSQLSLLRKMGHWCPTSVLTSLSSALSRFIYKYQLPAYCYTNFVFPFRSLHHIFLLIYHILPHANPSAFPIPFCTLVMLSPQIFSLHSLSSLDYLCL